MHAALILIARAIALAHDHWRHTVGRRRPLSGKIAVREEQLQRLRAENALFGARWRRIPGKRRPHCRPNERLEILWHAARYRRSINDTAAAFCVTWLVSDKDRALRNKPVNRLLWRLGIRRRYGAVGKRGSICLIERFWRSMKQEYVRHLFLYRSTDAIERRLRRYQVWFNEERAHQGLDQRTPDSATASGLSGRRPGGPQIGVSQHASRCTCSVPKPVHAGGE